MKKVIRLGDPTSHGGTVLSAAPYRTLYNKPVARMGDQVSCPIKGHSNCVIVEGDPSWIVDGNPVALEGHLVSCGAVLFSTLKEVDRDYVGHGTALSGAPSVKRQSVASTATSPDVYDQYFVIHDEITDEPLANRKYKLKWSGGITEGITNEQGHTVKVCSDKQEKITIEVFPENI